MKSKLSLTQGRIAQKLKTREALLAKGNDLLKQGIKISLEDVAKKAGISKATAYRYFHDSESFIREASLQLKAITREHLFTDIPKEDINGRLTRLIEYHFDLFIQNEAEFRLFLGSIITDSVKNKDTPSRGGRRVLLIEEALEGKRGSIDKVTFTRMVNSLSLIFGIESITILRDLCLLNNESILETWKWLSNKIIAEAK